MTEPLVEYFYGETLRWSFGFENPNKAAVLFACAMPFLWWGWVAAWKIRNLFLRLVALVMASAAFLGAGYCLSMTFSRGGLLAACVGVLYVVASDFREEKGRPAWKWISHAGLLACFAGLVMWTGLGARAGEAAGGDRSVGNRVELWKSALQMSVENPRGFGAGSSGAEYMQWYQNTDSEEGYRTMVNSYLTFLVERGWLAAAGVALVFTCFWAWTVPGVGNRAAHGMRGVILAFLTAGIFSTTMEDWRLWIFPGIAGVILVGMAVRRRAQPVKWVFLAYGGVTALLLITAAAFGWNMSVGDLIQREYSKNGIVSVGKRSGVAGSLGFIPDEKVMGPLYGKLLRELALKGRKVVYIGENALEEKTLMLAGKGVHSKWDAGVEDLILLAPEKIDEAGIGRLFGKSKNILLIVPEVDEDGRIGFWEEVAEKEGIELEVLFGLGTRVDWAWPEVIDLACPN